MAATLASVVSSVPASETAPILAIEEMANAKGKARRKAARKGKGKELVLGPMFGTTWGDDTFEIPYGECATSSSARLSEWEPDWVSRVTTPSKEHECMERGPSPGGSFLEPTYVEPGLPPRMAAPKLGLDETMELLSRVLGAGEEDPHLSALSMAPKEKLGCADQEKLHPTTSRGVELLTTDVKSCRGIRSPPMDTCPSIFRPRVRTVPVCSVGDTSEADMTSYDLAALTRLATRHPSSPSGGTSHPGVPGRVTKAIAKANLQIELPEFDLKNLPEWAEEFFEFSLLTGEQHADVDTKGHGFVQKLPAFGLRS